MGFNWKFVAVVATAAMAVMTLLGVWGWRAMTGPMFVPGDVAGRVDLAPPAHATADDSSWQVTRDISLAHRQSGSGRPMLVVHGGPGVPPIHSAPAFDALTDIAQVHYYDQRGTGDSTRPYTGATSTAMFENVQELERALGIGQQLADIERIRRMLEAPELTLVGHSYGALLTALYASEFPDHVAAMVLIAPADLLLFPSPHGGLFDNLRRRLPATEHDAYDTWLERYLDLGTVFDRTTEELRALDRELVTYFTTVTGPIPPGISPPVEHTGVWHARAQYFSMGMRHDWRGALAEIPAPVLIVHGEEDLQPQAVAQMYADALPNAEVISLLGAGHFPHYSDAEALAPVIRAFLER